MTRFARAWAAALLCFAGTACGHDFEPPGRAERVERAALDYRAELFDTVAWDDEADRLLRGNVVYAESCRRCHGPLGEGPTEYARGRGLAVPSLVGAEWAFSELDSLRRKLYHGHEDGMPIFGERGVPARDIDAAAGYILLMLRPEVAERQTGR